MRSPARHLPRAGAADVVLEQLERDAIADGEVVDRAAFTNIGPMKIDLAIVGQPDESVTLADEQPHDTPAARDPPRIRRTGAGSPRGRRPSGGAIKVLAHALPARFRTLPTHREADSSVAIATLPDRQDGRLVDVVPQPGWTSGGASQTWLVTPEAGTAHGKTQGYSVARFPVCARSIAMPHVRSGAQSVCVVRRRFSPTSRHHRGRRYGASRFLLLPPITPGRAPP
jgi:hypothetical protein